MLETVMHVSNNGADLTSTPGEGVVTQSVQQWYKAKQRRKLSSPGVQEGETITSMVKHQDDSTLANSNFRKCAQESHMRDFEEKIQKVLGVLNVDTQ